MSPEITRNTPQRRLILEELRKLETHPTAAELYEITRRRMPRISLGTVYRNLEVLTRAGQIRKLDLGGAEARYDGDTDRHYHVRCVSCGSVGDVCGLPSGSFGAGAEDLTDYEILGHRLEFVGLCPECVKREDTGAAETDGA